MSASYESVYKAALARWGPELQHDKLIEEAAELIKAVSKLKFLTPYPWICLEPGTDGYRALEALTDEMADVEIMIEQVAYLYDLRERIEQRKREKIARVCRWLMEAVLKEQPQGKEVEDEQV